ncbi:MAG: hypothetical protein OK456_06000 [Thaumarchaeota archaeon]|nr:hypothetical protein [Nitrososphaerota archaeon]
MEGNSELWEARKNIAWGNSTVALFSFCAAGLVFGASYLGLGVEAEGDSLFAESRTAVLILLTLSIIQSVYSLLVSRKKIRTTSESGHFLLDTENTYFVAFAAVAAALVYGISVLGHISDSLSALSASLILSVFFIVQLSYVKLSERRERKK